MRKVAEDDLTEVYNSLFPIANPIDSIEIELTPAGSICIEEVGSKRY